MPHAAVVYLDGEFKSASEARISVFDRGYLLAHAAYEVTAFYDGKLVDFEHHKARLARTLTALEIPQPSEMDGLEALHLDLIERNQAQEGLAYLQVTAGAYDGRDFAGPEYFKPSFFLWARERPLLADINRDGVSAITLPDTRWSRRDLKTTQLLSQALAYRAARRAGAFTAWMHEDGLVTEAASANAWIVLTNGVLATRDLSPALLPGVTRSTVARLCEAAGFTVETRPFSIEEARQAAEAFTTSTGAGILPILSLDGQPIGDGSPGPVTRAVQALYYQHMGMDVARVAPWAKA